MRSSWKIVGFVLAAGVLLFAASVVWLLPESTDEFNAVENSTIEELESPVLVSQTVNASPEVVEEQPESQEVAPPEAEVEVFAEQTAEQAPEQELVPGGDSRLDAMMQSEPVDPNWAPRMEATVEGVIASTGLTAYTEADWDFQCRTSVCRAHVTHVEGFDQDAFDLLVNEQLRPMMQSVVTGEMPRLKAFKVSTRHPTQITPLPGNKSQTSIYLFESDPMFTPAPGMPLLGESMPGEP